MKLSKMGKNDPIAMTLFPCAHKHCWTRLLDKALIPITNQCYIEYSDYRYNKSWLSSFIFYVYLDM